MGAWTEVLTREVSDKSTTPTNYASPGTDFEQQGSPGWNLRPAVCVKCGFLWVSFSPGVVGPWPSRTNRAEEASMTVSVTERTFQSLLQRDTAHFSVPG